MEMTKGGRNSKLHLAPDAQGMPVRAFLTADPVADCRVAPALIEGLSADVLLACCGDDSDALIPWPKLRGWSRLFQRGETGKTHVSLATHSTEIALLLGMCLRN